MSTQLGLFFLKLCYNLVVRIYSLIVFGSSFVGCSCCPSF